MCEFFSAVVACMKFVLVQVSSVVEYCFSKSPTISKKSNGPPLTSVLLQYATGWRKKTLAPLCHPIRSKNQSSLVRNQFPALRVSHTHLLRDLIGSLDRPCPFWLATVITLVLVQQHLQKPIKPRVSERRQSEIKEHSPSTKGPSQLQLCFCFYW